MKLTIKYKLFSLSGSAKVLDEENKEVLKVKGKIFSIRRKKKICSLDGATLYSVKNKFFNWWLHTTFIYNAQGQKIASVKNRGLKGGYDVVGYGDEISLNGFGVTGYTIIKNGEKIGKVKPKTLSTTVTYEVELSNPANSPFIATVVVALNNIHTRATR